MTPKNAKARQEAIEALIAACLRAPKKEPEVTEEEINRYLEQHVTLSPEEESALEKSKPGVMQAIKGILQENKETDHATAARPEKAERAERLVPLHQRIAPSEFIEAILIAQITRSVATPQFPLGHLRQNKLVYFAHRKADEDVAEYFRKLPAGPYSPRSTYQGPEKIAQQNGYIKRAKSGKFFGFVVGDNIDKIDRYISHYPICAAVDWVVEKFLYFNKEKLELLATVDFAVLELLRKKKAITMENVRSVIATTKAWSAKLRREIFSDENILQALTELRELFPKTYA